MAQEDTTNPAASQRPTRDWTVVGGTVTWEEKDRVKAAAKKVGATVSTFVREAVLARVGEIETPRKGRDRRKAA